MDDLRSMAYRREIARLRAALGACVEHAGRFLEREPAEAHFDSYDTDRDAAGLAVAQAREVLKHGAPAGCS